MSTRRLYWVLCAALGTGVAALPLQMGVVEGRIEVTGGGKTSIPGEGAVVWISGPPGQLATSGPPPTMASKDKRFEPHVLAVTKGTTIRFPNFDKIHHNVFSRTPGTEFDLGLYRGGNFREFQFANPGLVRVYCNIHSQMAGYIMVVDGPAFAVADAMGHYRLENVPEGHREVHFWHEKGREQTVFVDVVPGHAAALDLTLDGSNIKEAPHKNKYGQDYPPIALDDDRY